MATPILTPEQAKYLQQLRECIGDGNSVYTDSAKLADLLKLLPPTPPRVKTERELDYEAYDKWIAEKGHWNLVTTSEAFLAGCESVRTRQRAWRCTAPRSTTNS